MTHSAKMGLVGLLLATLGACGDEEAPEGRAGDATAALTPPEPPVFTPCPDGWTEVAPSSEDGVTTCSPWPDGVSQSCASDEAHFAGEPGCSQIGGTCPDGDWAENLPSEGSILYVREGESAGGAGTTDSPFASIGDATRAAAAGTIIAVGKGTFEEMIELPAGVTLWGACVAETVVAAPAPSTTESAITVRGMDAGVRNLQLTGPAPGITVGGGASVQVEDVLVDGAEQWGVQVSDNGQLSAHGLVIRNIQNEEGPGPALGLITGAQADVSRAVFERNGAMSIIAMGSGTRLTGGQLVVRQTVPQIAPEEGVLAVGLVAVDADVEVSAALFECNLTNSVVALGPRGLVSLRDVVIRGLPVPDSCSSGMGLFAGEGARVDVGRALFDHNWGAAIWVDDGTQLTLSDAIVRNTGLTYESLGVGLFVEDAQATLTRVIFENNTGLSIAIWREDSELDAEDLVVKDTAPLPCADPCTEPTYGIGAQSAVGAVVRMTRFEVAGNDLCGLQLAEAGEMDLMDGLVRDNPVGVNVQTDPFDLDRLTNRVLYLDNERNLDSSSLPVPNPAVFLAQ